MCICIYIYDTSARYISDLWYLRVSVNTDRHHAAYIPPFPTAHCGILPPEPIKPSLADLILNLIHLLMKKIFSRPPHWPQVRRPLHVWPPSCFKPKVGTFVPVARRVAILIPIPRTNPTLACIAGACCQSRGKVKFLFPLAREPRSNVCLLVFV